MSRFLIRKFEINLVFTIGLIVKNIVSTLEAWSQNKDFCFAKTRPGLLKKYNIFHKVLKNERPGWARFKRGGLSSAVGALILKLSKFVYHILRSTSFLSTQKDSRLLKETVLKKSVMCYLFYTFLCAVQEFFMLQIYVYKKFILIITFVYCIRLFLTKYRFKIILFILSR